jgi:hypothetical protein
MTDIVVDVQILMFASGKRGVDQYKNAVMLLRTVQSNSVALVVDDEGLIISQYKRKTGPGSVGMEFVRSQASRGRLKAVARSRISNAIKHRLRNSGFNCTGEDFNYYVRTTAASVDKVLVSEDADYSAPVCNVLSREVGIIVTDAYRAVGRITA